MAYQNDVKAVTQRKVAGDKMTRDMQKKCDEGEHYMHGTGECMKDSEMKGKK